MKRLVIILFMCGIARGGTLVTFGPNAPSIPAEISGDDIAAIATGNGYLLVLEGNDVIRCRPDGFLENVSQYCSSEETPVFISMGFSNWSIIFSDGSLCPSVSCSGSYWVKAALGAGWRVALDSDGSLCDKSPSRSAPPGQYTDIARGGDFGTAIRADGSLVAWYGYGDDQYGECNVPDGNDYASVAAGYYHGLAIKEDGTVVGWGRNDYGQADTPDGTFVRVDGGIDYSIGIKDDGTLYMWGNTAGWVLPEGNDFVEISAESTYCAALRSPTDSRVSLTLQVEPNQVDSTLPVAGQYEYFTGARVLVRSLPWIRCPDVSRMNYWSGDIADPCSQSQYIIMDSNKTITANYTVDERWCGDECHPISELYDRNRDCRVDLVDFAIFAADWGCTHPDCD